MRIKEDQIIRILIEQRFVSEEDIKQAKLFSEKHEISVIDSLKTLNLINKDLLGQAISEFYKVDYWDLNSKEPSVELLKKLNPEYVKDHHVIIAYEDENKVIIVSDDPEKKDELVDSFKNVMKGKKVIYNYSLTEDIEGMFIHFQKPLKEQIDELIKENDTDITQIVNIIIKDAVNRNASDIHVEPLEEEVVIRYRIDGLLKKYAVISKDLYSNILNRIKVLAHLRIDQKFSTQDGAVRFKDDEFKVDLRVSIVPIVEGQKIVIRILSKYIRTLDLEDLGLEPDKQALIEEAGSKPFGMILTTGPTGSGKTTTLYSLIKKIQDESLNITTIEDPVEYRIQGVNQIQVNKDVDLTFANGLRSIVRQDPNVILVGEIRDEETADISVNAALTGHLVLSTFHANDAATVIPRLIDLKVEPFLIASTINLIIGQRLVRKICESCRSSKNYTLDELEKTMPEAKKYFSNKRITLYEAEGCENCNGQGYKGRIGVFEFIEVDKGLKDLILTKPSSQEIKKYADENKMHTFFDDAVEKVKSGLTTLDEILRVVPRDEIVKKSKNAK